LREEEYGCSDDVVVIVIVVDIINNNVFVVGLRGRRRGRIETGARLVVVLVSSML
jgi:hypothetical protein